MSPSVGKRTCPTCGQSVNIREIPLTDVLIDLLWRIFVWARDNEKHEFDRKEISHLFRTETEIANFGYMAWFGLLYHPNGKRGRWGIHMERTDDIFRGRRTVPLLILKDPLRNQIELRDYKLVSDVPSFKKFLDDNHEYIAMYRGGQPELL